MKDFAVIDLFLCRMAAVALPLVIWFPQHTKTITFVYCAIGTLILFTYLVAALIDFISERINNDNQRINTD